MKVIIYFCNSLSSSIQKNINLSPCLTLNTLICPLILRNIKTNGTATLSKYPFEYLELVFVSSYFEIAILSTLTYQIFVVFSTITFIFAILSLIIPTLVYCQKNLLIIFYLIDRNIFLIYIIGVVIRTFIKNWINEYYNITQSQYIF